MPKQTYKALQTELDKVLDELQTGNLEVDTAIKRYERGMELIKLLESYLADAENKIRLVKKV